MTGNVLHYLQYRPLRHRQTLITINAREAHRSSYMNRLINKIVAKRYSYSDYQNEPPTTIAMNFWFVLPPLIGRYRNSFLRPYNHSFHITYILQHWRDTWRKRYVRLDAMRIISTLRDSWRFHECKRLWRLCPKCAVNGTTTALQLLTASGPLEYVETDILGPL